MGLFIHRRDAAGWQVTAPRPRGPKQGPPARFGLSQRCEAPAMVPVRNDGDTPTLPHPRGSTLEKSPMSSWSSLASRFSISSSRADRDGSSHAPCRGTTQRHPQMSATALPEQGRGPGPPGTVWVTPHTFPSTHRLHRRLLARAAGPPPLPLGLDRAVAVRGLSPLQDQPGDTARLRGRAGQRPALAALPRTWGEPVLLPGALASPSTSRAAAKAPTRRDQDKPTVSALLLLTNEWPQAPQWRPQEGIVGLYPFPKGNKAMT